MLRIIGLLSTPWMECGIRCSSVCDNVVSSISSSSQTQEQQIAGLEATQKQVNAFIDLTINRDNSAADAVSKAKDDFYKEYSYLKPECEKSGWEKFCDGLKNKE